MSPRGLIPRARVNEAPGTSMGVKSNARALAGMSSVNTITRAYQATNPIVRMAGFSFETGISDLTPKRRHPSTRHSTLLKILIALHAKGQSGHVGELSRRFGHGAEGDAPARRGHRTAHSGSELSL